jgi:hypothetical protein
MMGFEAGNRVRVDIPDETDPDHDAYHGRHGRIVATMTDDAATETGNPVDGTIYRVEFEQGNRADFRQRDLRPPIEES